MPRPVDALPCGSESISSTRSPTAASAVPRLMAVVVLPTPPFWLATASTRGPDTRARGASVDLAGRGSDTAEPFDAQNPPGGITPAGRARPVEVPHQPRLGQFRFDAFALQKQADRGPC